MLESLSAFEQAWLFIVLSVVMHVSWNLMARHVDPKADFLWWGLLGHIVLLGGYGLYHLAQVQWSWTLAGLIGITAFANSLYFLSLRQAYALAPVAFVYPIARSSPILVAIWAWWLFDEHLSVVAITGILLSVIGLWLLGNSVKHNPNPKVLLWTLAAAFFTSIYSLSDKAISQQITSFSALIGVVTIGYFSAWIGLTIYRKRHCESIIPKARPHAVIWLLGSLFIGTAYALIILAMQTLPTAYVVSMSNLGILLAVIISILFFNDKEHLRLKMLSTFLIVAGLAILGAS
ncbi:MAG: EamA family transporter [Pseudomonadota bacterium]|nr:EamA family transporter [Pseudomonadota bacterium]